MPTVAAQSTARQVREHTKAVADASKFFQELAKSAELPLTSTEFEERVKEFFAELSRRTQSAQAFMLAAVRDEPCPQEFFSPWASRQTIYEWRQIPEDPLPAEELNGKICVRPSDFFAALKLHGSSRARC